MARRKSLTYGPKPKNIVLAWLSGGNPEHTFVTSVAETLLLSGQTDRTIKSFIAIESSPRIAAGRNDLVKTFLDMPGAEWLFMVDDDMEWKAADVEKARTILQRNPDVKILGGLCFGGGRSNLLFPTLYVLTSKDPVVFGRVYDFPEDALVEVNATGAAWIWIHRSVLEDLKDAREFVNGKPNPMIWYRDGTSEGVAYGEDIWFCLQAGAVGYKTYVHTGLDIGHVKRHSLNLEKFHYMLEKGDLIEDPVKVDLKNVVNVQSEEP